MQIRDRDDSQAVVDAINQRRDDRLRLLHRFAVGGGAEAFAVERGLGEAAVLKWWPDTPVQRRDRDLRLPRVDRLRELGWPIPQLLEMGETDTALYEVWERVPGDPGVDLMPTRVIEQATALIELAKGAALGDGLEWPAWLSEFVGDATDEAVSRATPQGLAILDSCRQAVERCALPAAVDIIHGDFGPANCLVQDDEIVAVIDFDACRDGNGVLDLFGVVWDLEGWQKADVSVRDGLWNRIKEQTTPEHGLVFAAFWIAGSMKWAAGTEYEAHVVQTANRVIGHFAS